MNVQKKPPGCYVFFLAVLSVFLLSIANTVHADVADYVGAYAGTFESEDEEDRGILRCTVKPDGSARVISWSTISNSGELVTGTVDTNGNFSFSNLDPDMIIEASIDDSGEITVDYSLAPEGIEGKGSALLVTRESILQFIGDYALVYTDYAASLWLIIYSDGLINSAENLSEDAVGPFEGAVGPDRKFLLATETGDTVIYGEIDHNGEVNGYWYKPGSGTQGSVAGSDRNLDNDGDGFTENQGDCNDENAVINPEATEICGDNIDQDCNGADLSCNEGNDADKDGYDESEGDCNDDDPTINPGATEICGDNIDQDCNGADLVCGSDDGGDKSSSSAGCFLSTTASII